MLSGRLEDRSSPSTEAARPARSAWRERELLVLVLLVGGLYLSRLADLSIRGEESRWARVAQEMLETGDLIVPRQQGEPFLDRPPLGSWAMLASAQLRGRLDLVAVRMPTVVATLLISVLVYLYGRNHLSRLGALAAAAAYPTMAQVLQLGRLAESDSLLTLAVSAALFTWHYAYDRRRDARLAWCAGYALAAAAGLAKGPQGPLYFVAITSVFLILRRDWKFLFSRWHLAGLAAFALVLGCWQVPFLLKVGPAGVEAIWSEGGEVGSRFHYGTLRHALARWSAYPLEVVGSTLPWSLMLLVVPTRWFRSNLGDARPMFAFLLTALAVTFPTCWLPADSRPRYFMSLYPSMALIIGLAIERCWESSRDSFWLRSWDRYLSLGTLIILAAALVVGGARWTGVSRLKELGQSVSPEFALAYFAAAIAAASALVWSARGTSVARGQLGVLAIAGFMGLTSTGVVISVQMRKSNDPRAAVASVRELIPEGERLLSFGPVHHLFAYYYGESIELGEVTETGQAPDDFSNTYFCYADDPFFETPEIPFEWDLVAEISCERARSKFPLTKVVVGRRRMPPTTASSPVRQASATLEAAESSATATAADFKAEATAD